MVVTIVLTADSMKQLDEDTKAIMNTAAGDHCQLGILRFQQMDGLVTAIPFGVRRIDNFRTMTTESLTALHPFRVQDAFHRKGIYLGQNIISNNMIVVDVGELMNGNSLVLGVPGGGKSMISKYSLFARFLSDPNCDIMIIDIFSSQRNEKMSVSCIEEIYNYLRAFDKTLQACRAANLRILDSWMDARSVMMWWVGDNPRQLSLFGEPEYLIGACL